MEPDDHTQDQHLAEFNIGILKHDWDDPRVKDFVDGLDLVNAVAARSPGFVWRLSDDDMDVAQNDQDGPLGGNPRTASTLSVWESVAALEAFVWNTVHRQFYARKDEWYDLSDALRFVMWWVPKGHRPTIAEAADRFRMLEINGPSNKAFGWRWVEEARLWRTQQCTANAAE